LRDELSEELLSEQLPELLFELSAAGPLRAGVGIDSTATADAMEHTFWTTILFKSFADLSYTQPRPLESLK
jgi:hypothetical protein